MSLLIRLRLLIARLLAATARSIVARSTHDGWCRPGLDLFDAAPRAHVFLQREVGTSIQPRVRARSDAAFPALSMTSRVAGVTSR
jgi:hypothetical protein